MALRKTVEALARRLDRAVVLYDADLNLVEFSPDGAASDDARRLNVLARHASTAAEELIRRFGVNRAHGPVRIPAVPGARARVLVAIRHAERLVGYLAYIDDAEPDLPIPGYDTDALHVATPEIGRALERRRLAAERARAHENRLLSRLLSGHPADEAGEAADDLLGAGFVAAAPAYGVAVARVAGGPDRPDEEARLLLGGLMSGIATFSADPVPWLPHDDHVALVVGYPARGCDAWSVPVLTRLAEAAHASAEPVHIGVGAPRGRLADAAEAHREALIAVEAALRSPKRYGGAAAWDALGADRLLARLPLDRMNRDDLPPVVRALLTGRTGGTAGTVLAGTLAAYLDHACDAQATARDLMIHRSTLYYRLGRVRELTGADLADGPTRLELHAGLRTAHLLDLL